MSAVGNAIGTAIVANRAAVIATFNASRKPGPYSKAELLQIALLEAQAEGNAIADNIGPLIPAILVGIGNPPDPTGLADGTLYFKYNNNP